MKKLLFLLFFTSLAYSQTINFMGCPNLFDSNTYVFNKISTDVYGRNVYQTTPIDGAQDCGGLGVCEFQISWNNSQNRWEFIADDGNGDFSSTYLDIQNIIRVYFDHGRQEGIDRWVGHDIAHLR